MAFYIRHIHLYCFHFNIVWLIFETEADLFEGRTRHVQNMDMSWAGLLSLLTLNGPYFVHAVGVEIIFQNQLTLFFGEFFMEKVDNKCSVTVYISHDLTKFAYVHSLGNM